MTRPTAAAGLAPGGQQAYWAAPSPAIAEMLVRAGADCLASHKGPFGRPTGSALSILHNLPYNPVLTNSQVRRAVPAVPASVGAAAGCCFCRGNASAHSHCLPGIAAHSRP